MIYVKGNDKSKVIIKKIRIVGTEETNGGALDCVKCPAVFNLSFIFS
jgi:hypothetical protein